MQFDQRGDDQTHQPDLGDHFDAIVGRDHE
jgi:hypothetical protein